MATARADRLSLASSRPFQACGSLRSVERCFTRSDGRRST